MLCEQRPPNELPISVRHGIRRHGVGTLLSSRRHTGSPRVRRPVYRPLGAVALFYRVQIVHRGMPISHLYPRSRAGLRGQARCEGRRYFRAALPELHEYPRRYPSRRQGRGTLNDKRRTLTSLPPAFCAILRARFFWRRPSQPTGLAPFPA